MFIYYVLYRTGYDFCISHNSHVLFNNILSLEEGREGRNVQRLKSKILTWRTLGLGRPPEITHLAWQLVPESRLGNFFPPIPFKLTSLLTREPSVGSVASEILQRLTLEPCSRGSRCSGEEAGGSLGKVYVGVTSGGLGAIRLMIPLDLRFLPQPLNQALCVCVCSFGRRQTTPFKVCEKICSGPWQKQQMVSPASLSPSHNICPGVRHSHGQGAVSYVF